jgi:uncharacterized membrane protein YraQ (UPF0718 family)
MNTATLILVTMAGGLLTYAWRRGDGSHRRGVHLGGQTLRRTTPILILAFIISGYVTVLSPQDLVQTWIGPESGWQGVFLGTGVGMFLPGGPYIVFPLIGILYEAGAGLGQTLAIISSWTLLGLLRLSFEIPFMGWRFTAVRWGLALTLPVVIGLVAQVLFRR